MARAGEPLHELVGSRCCYDWIIASHVIEHVSDFVSFLQECEGLLKPDGVISLVIPDKRYCFDHFNSVTSTGYVLDAWQNRRSCPSSGQVFDHMANAAKRGGSIAWSPSAEGRLELIHSMTDTRVHWERARTDDGTYIDVHCWRFTPASFRVVLADLQMLGLTRLGIAAEFDTVDHEFFVSLKIDAERKSEGRLVLLRQQQEEASGLAP